jgi:hypothetical protein
MARLEWRVVMTRHTMLLSAVFIAVLGVSISAPAKTAPETQLSWTDDSQPESMQSAQLHDMVGASFHAFHAGF